MIVISDDEEKPLAPVATVPSAEHEQAPVAAEEWFVDDGIERPGWLPDGFDIEGYDLPDGTFKTTAYICPVSGTKFTSRTEVLDYCFTGGIDSAIAAEETTLDDQSTLQVTTPAFDKSTLQGKYTWLMGKPGWIIEIRAGGENFSKMFKFFTHPITRVRFATKDEVIRYIHEAELPEGVYEDCDTSTEDNIIAQLELSINPLPFGWVKETAFRKCSDGIRKDTFYTDPVTKKVFRSLKSAEQYLATGEALGAHCPVMSVTDMYSFDRCTDMLPCFARRLKMEGTGDQQCQTPCRKKRKTEKAKGKAATGTPGGSKTPKPRWRP